MLSKKPPPANRTARYSMLCCVVGLFLVTSAVAYTRMQSKKLDLLAETRRALDRGSWKGAVEATRVRKRADFFDPNVPPSLLLVVQSARRADDLTLCRQVVKELIDHHGHTTAAFVARRILKEIDGAKVEEPQWQRMYQSYRGQLSAVPWNVGQEKVNALFANVRRQHLENTDRCGTCRLETKRSHENCILLASVHSQRSSDFCDWAWRLLATDGFADFNTFLFALMRQYESAGQRTDFTRLWDELKTRAKRHAESATSNQPGNYTTQAKVISARSRSVHESIALLSGDCDEWLATFKRTTKDDPLRPLWSASLPRNVAAWLLLRDYATTTEKIVAAAQSGEYHVHRLAELLVLINSPASVDGLRKLIELPNEKDRAAVCRVILSQMTGPDDLILQAVMAAGKNSEIAEVSPRLEIEFLRPWPQAGQNSMPRELPPDLFDPEET